MTFFLEGRSEEREGKERRKMKNENEDSPRKEINTTKHFWLILFFST